MEILIGRVTADAKINALKEEKKVVNFSIAINHSYKSKGSSETKQSTTYVNCSYWISTGIADYLKKGTLVELCGNVSVSAWTNMKGEAKGSLNLHVTNIKLHGSARSVDDSTKANVETVGQPQEMGITDDLPF